VSYYAFVLVFYSKLYVHLLLLVSDAQYNYIYILYCFWDTELDVESSKFLKLHLYSHWGGVPQSLIMTPAETNQYDGPWFY